MIEKAKVGWYRVRSVDLDKLTFHEKDMPGSSHWVLTKDTRFQVLHTQYLGVRAVIS